MFNNKRIENELKQEIKELKLQIDLLKSDHCIEINEINSRHRLEISDKDHEMKNWGSEKTNKLKEEIKCLERENAVIKEKNAMLDRIVDLNGDIVDVKELINVLIKKLPEINLSSLTINGNDTK